MIPGSVTDAFAKNEILPILLFSTLFGIALSHLGPRGKRFSGMDKLRAFKDVWGTVLLFTLVIGGITMTGLASKFSTLVFLLSGHDLFISLIVAAVAVDLRKRTRTIPS